ncbi:GntR family transcriptional regulator [Desulfosediminicola ganghwensis]|uniref:GntR family transcriptional regulator n=1 Tax=Desulfosediminicola ganghwensis TaxID=2569540 RepID=UPI0010ACEF92|nr:GntR family transcriptional regulator [Desulfosediminicola ganghwensis]
MSAWYSLDCRQSTRSFLVSQKTMPILKRTYKDQVTEYIYDLVLDGDLSPGDQIKESWLAAEMGISRAPIREALKELITNGIIEYRPQVGNFITHLSPKEIIDAYTTRGILEGYAIMITRKQFSEDEIEELEGMTKLMEKYALKDNRKMVVNVGDTFHSLLISKNKNIQLIDYTERLSQKLHILFYKFWSKLYTPTEIGERHLRIVTSLKSGDPHRIEETIRDHYTETGTKIAELRKPEIRKK